jgi:HK97 family phage portal protein
MVWPFPSRKPQIEIKEHPAGAAFLIGSNAQWSRANDRRSYIKEGYQHNVIVYRAIREIVEACKAISIELYQGDTLIEQHPALDLLDRPNPWQAYDQWLSEMMVNRLLFGETFCVGAPDGQFAELWPLNPIDVEVTPGPHGLPSAYTHKRGKHETRFAVDPLTGQSEVFYLKTYNPDNYWRGQSPLMAAALAADTHNAGSSWNYSLLKNSARPSGLVRFKGGYPGGEAIQRMREYFKAALSGERNAGEIPMLADDAEFVELSKSPMDMDFINTMKETAKYVASAFGVPLPLIDNDASTFNNLEQAKERLYTDTVIPLMDEFMGALSAWLLPRYSEGLEFRLDLDSISALEGNRQRMFDRAVLAFEKGVLTREESRMMMGFPAEGEGEYTPLLAAPMEQKAEGYTPTDGMKEEARKGLEWRKEFNRGGTEVGVARARDIMNGKNLSADTVKRMHSFFSRHEVDKQAEGFSPGEDGYPSAGRIAWALWGGDAGQSWARDKVRAMDDDKSLTAAELLHKIAYG